MDLGYLAWTVVYEYLYPSVDYYGSSSRPSTLQHNCFDVGFEKSDLDAD